jgi:hypothetical protein
VGSLRKIALAHPADQAARLELLDFHLEPGGRTGGTTSSRIRKTLLKYPMKLTAGVATCPMTPSATRSLRRSGRAVGHYFDKRLTTTETFCGCAHENRDTQRRHICPKQ